MVMIINKMKCIYCNSNNIEGARFCRNCGKELSEGNVMDTFPSYDFVPASVLKWPVSLIWKLLFYLSMLLIIISILFELNMIEPYQWRPEHYLPWMLLWGIILCISVFILAYSYKKITVPNYTQLADYIQRISTNSPRYLFFCKNGKMGFLDIKRCQVQIPAIYDVLEWKTSQSIIVAQKDNQTSYIDIYGKELE